MKAEEERMQKEKRLREEQEREKREEEKRKQEEIEKQKKAEEYERIGKWKSTKAPDFEENIFCAAEQGKLTSIIYLLANGTNVNEKYHKDHVVVFKDVIEEFILGSQMEEATPIHFATLRGHLSIVEYLVNHKADINAKAKDDLTPLHLASVNGHLSVVEYLVNQKADINAKNSDVEFLYLMILLFIMLLGVIILIL